MRAGPRGEMEDRIKYAHQERIAAAEATGGGAGGSSWQRAECWDRLPTGSSRQVGAAGLLSALLE